MARPKKYVYVLITTVAAVALSACVVRPNEPTSTTYGTMPENTQANTTSQTPYYYRGTASNMAPANNDAAITANVIQAMGRTPGATNLRVSTLNGAVTLSGVTDTQLTAQQHIEAARQVPGVLRVDYDLEVRRQ